VTMRHPDLLIEPKDVKVDDDGELRFRNAVRRGVSANLPQCRHCEHNMSVGPVQAVLGKFLSESARLSPVWCGIQGGPARCAGAYDWGAWTLSSPLINERLCGS